MKKVVIEARIMLCEYLNEMFHSSGADISSLNYHPPQRDTILSILSSQKNPSLEEFISIAQSLNCYIFIIDKDKDDNLVKVMKDRWGKTSTN
jgi:hypothetical protein